MMYESIAAIENEFLSGLGMGRIVNLAKTATT